MRGGGRVAVYVPRGGGPCRLVDLVHKHRRLGSSRSRLTKRGQGGAGGGEGGGEYGLE